MADDIKIIVRVEGDKDIVKTTQSLKRMETGVRTLSKDLDAGRISENQFNTGLKELRRTVDSSFGSWQKAKSSVDAYAKSLKQAEIAKAALDNTAALNKMRSAYDRTYAVEQKTLRLKKLLRQEIANNNMTVREAGAELLRYRKSLIATNSVLQQSGRRTNQLGVLMQQTGYQVGDFAVQVQSGTNVMVALGQQATQLVGTFGMLAKSTKMIGLFAGLGIAIPIITGIAGAIMRTSEDAEAAEPKVESFKDIVQELTDKAKASTQELRLFHSALKTIEQLKTTDKIAEIREEIANLDKSAEEVIRGFVEGMGGGEAQVAAALANIDSPEFQRVLANAERIKEQEIATLNAKLERLAAAEKLLDIENSYRELMGELKDEAAEQAQLRKESIADAAIELSAMSDKLLLLQIEADLGKDSVAYREELLRQEQSRIIALFEQGKITEKQAEDYLRLFEETQKVTGEIDSSADSAKNLADALKEAASAMASLSGFSDSLDKKLAVSVAKVQALKSGADAAVAGSIAAMRADLDQKISAAKSSGVDSGIVERMYGGLRGRISSYEASETERKRLEEANKSSSRGSKTSETNEKYLDNLLRETKLKAQLVGVSEQEAAKLKLLNTLEAKGIDLNDDRVKTLIEEQKNLAELEKAYEAQQEMVGMFKDTLTDALMSVIDGSRSVADAFKNMMRQILSSLAQKSIIQPLVSGLTGGIAGGATGGLMGGLASGTGIAATMGTIGSSLGAGFMTSVYGGLAGTAGAVSGGLAVGGASGIATAIGAVAAPLLAVAAVFSFFKKKTKELDSGIRATVTNMDSYVETFKVIQTKRFWGLSKKVRTDTTAMDAGNPISAAIASVQQSIASTAQYLGIATDSLNDFSYEFELSLKGLSEEARMQKITEEVNKLTDAFAGLLPNVQNMQHLTDIMNERYSLETRLLEAQGNTEALRERELANTNEYNRAILEQIFAAEDAKAALDNLNNSLKETDFATLLDFNRAKAYARLGMNVANSPEVPSMSNTAASGVQAITSPMNTASGEIVQLRSEMKEMHKEAMFAYSKLIKNSKDSRDTLRSWDVVGLPAERTA